VIATRTLSSTRCSRRNGHNRSPPPPFRKHFGYVRCEFKYHKTNKTKVVINAATVIEGLMLSGGQVAALTGRRSKYLRCMKAKRFVEAVMQLKFAEVLDDEDFRRVNDLYVEAIEHSVDRVLVGFRVRGPVVRIVWAVIEVIPVGPLADEDLAPGLPPSEAGYEAWDARLDRFTFTQGPTAELAELEERPRFQGLSMVGTAGFEPATSRV
jgi:hypothetical protein